MSSILRIQFTKDFESKYLAYKAGILADDQGFVLDKNAPIPLPLIKKYSDVQESIHLKTLGIEIGGRYITKGTQKAKINSTDRCLIYFLYFKYMDNSDECFALDRLVSEPNFDGKKKDDGYIKNRIAHINKVVRELVVKGKTNIGDFIKYETDRGYHLNQKFLQVTK